MTARWSVVFTQTNLECVKSVRWFIDDRVLLCDVVLRFYVATQKITDSVRTGALRRVCVLIEDVTGIPTVGTYPITL